MHASGSTSKHVVLTVEVTPDRRFRIVAYTAVEPPLAGVHVRYADARGHYVDDFVPTGAAPALLDSYRRCVETGQPQIYDVQVERPTGLRYYETTLVPLANDAGCVERIVAVCRDVSAESEALLALRASEERFRQLAEHIREVFWMTDPDKTEMLYVSPAYETIWGRTCESLRSVPRSWLDAIHASDRARVESVLHAQRQHPTESIYRIVRPDQSERWIRDRSFPIRDENGDVPRIVGIAEDITELVQTEERFRQAQKLEAVGQLASGVAHDFNNLLSVILSYAEMLRADLEPGDLRRDDLDEVLRAGERGADLTRQLLAFSRRQVLQPRSVDLRATVHGMERMLRRVLAGNIELVLVDALCSGHVWADAGQIEQVVLNLVVNAGDAMPDGGRLTIETSTTTLDADAAAAISVPPGRYVVLTMRDDGIGMDAATRARIFEPFFTTKTVGKGTGLGLSTVFGIVKQSGGGIRVDTAPGEGTSFELYFPRTGAAPSLTVPPSPATTLRGTETILLVENEKQVRAVAHTILRRAGYTVLEAQNVGDALLVSEQYPGTIHLLVTDLVMPRLSGRQLAERLASRRPAMKVLYMSGHADDSRVHDGAPQEGAFLQKPITPDALARKVRDVLDDVR